MGCGQSTRRVAPTSLDPSKDKSQRADKTLTKTQSTSADSTKPSQTKKKSGLIKKKPPVKSCEKNNTQTTELDGEYENPARTPCSTVVKYVDNKWVYIKDGEVIKVEDSQPVDDLTKHLRTGKTSDDLAMKAH